MMSEDSLYISFEASENLDPDRVAALVSRYADECECEAPEIHYSGGSGEIDIEFCMFDTEVMKKVICQLQEQGAREVAITARYDGTGERVIYAMFGGRLLSFESVDALNEYKREQARPVAAAIKFPYGKDRRNRTALVRLKTASKQAMERIAAVFNDVLAQEGEKDFTNFYREFAALNGSDEREIRWCALRVKGRDKWYQGPEELISGLKFVVEEDGHLYLGFDLEGIAPSFGPGGRSWDEEVETMVYVFDLLDGVKKVWVKVRPGANTARELYTYFPGMGDTAIVLRRPLTEDSEWPRARG